MDHWLIKGKNRNWIQILYERSTISTYLSISVDIYLFLIFAICFEMVSTLRWLTARVSWSSLGKSSIHVYIFRVIRLWFSTLRLRSDSSHLKLPKLCFWSTQYYFKRCFQKFDWIVVSEKSDFIPFRRLTIFFIVLKGNGREYKLIPLGVYWINIKHSKIRNNFKSMAFILSCFWIFYVSPSYHCVPEDMSL